MLPRVSALEVLLSRQRICKRISCPTHQSLLSAGLGTLTLGLIITVQTTYVFSQLPGSPVFYKQFADHLAWTTGNAGCAQACIRT